MSYEETTTTTTAIPVVTRQNLTDKEFEKRTIKSIGDLLRLSMQQKQQQTVSNKEKEQMKQ